jgi:hypothetical protein
MKKEDEKRSLKQNSALHKFFELLADELYISGLDIRRTLKEDFEIPWNPILVKEIMWKGLQKAILNKEHTADLTKKEVDQVYDVLNRWLGEKHHIHVPFPSEDEVY